MNLSRENWLLLSALLDTVLELPQEQRLSWIDGLETGNAEIKAQLRELLASNARRDDVLHNPPDFSAALLEEAKRFEQIETELQPEKLIGPYRLLRELGKGGMGTVWLAQRVDGKFRREVALKFPYAGPQQRQLAERLLRERDILASLQHANIARLYDADVTASGQPFLVLEYIDGVAINYYCDQHQLDIRARLILFQQVLSAVRYAHAHLVIHRDLKPSNILITSDGVAHLLDFGIATSITDGKTHETPLTRIGGHLLTLEYASPEQIAKIPVTTASDVYALGIVLYELLTGTWPYQYVHEQRARLEQAIADADVITPSHAAISKSAARNRSIQAKHLRNKLRGELDTLLLKALKKNIDDRYASADAFHEDIKRYLNHQPILARPDSQWYRIKKFVDRNRVVVAFVVAIALTLIGGSGVALWQAHIARQQRDRAVALATRGEAITEFMRLMITETADADEPVTMQTLLARTEKVATETFANNPDQQIAVLEVLGEYYLTMQRSELASHALNKALELAANGSDAALRGRLNCGAGAAFGQMGDIKRAQKLMETGLALSRNYPEVNAECLYTHAYITYYTEGAIGMLRD
ncbi:MAG: serine/threonine-protein kinase, partial [Steroidobacter sp.]